MKHLIETRVKYSAGTYSVRICGKTASSTSSAGLGAEDER